MDQLWFIEEYFRNHFTSMSFKFKHIWLAIHFHILCFKTAFLQRFQCFDKQNSRMPLFVESYFPFVRNSTSSFDDHTYNLRSKTKNIYLLRYFDHKTNKINHTAIALAYKKIINWFTMGCTKQVQTWFCMSLLVFVVSYWYMWISGILIILQITKNHSVII